MTRDHLLQRLARVDRVRTELLDELAGLDPALLSAHPVPDKWSVLEIIEHLVLAENALLRRLEGPDRPDARRTIRDRVAYQIVMLILRFDIPVKVPSKAMVPDGTRDFAGLRAEWDENHRALRERVAALEDLDRPIAVHPIAGPMAAAQSVAMLDVHVRRHIRQVRARLAAAQEAEAVESAEAA